MNVSGLYRDNFQSVLDQYDEQMSFRSENMKAEKFDYVATRPRWNLWTGLYYAATLYTTIGYGDITARTAGGRVFTVLYALVGIPLVISVLNIWGGGLFEAMRSLWTGVVLR